MSYGTYQIVCKTTGKKYIGSSWAGIEGRWKWHLNRLRDGNHGTKFQNAWNKYGESDFFFGILDVLPSDKNVCLKREQEYFDSVPHDDLLNTKFYASGSNGGANKGKTTAKKGTKQGPPSPEASAKQSAAQRGKQCRKRGPQSPETRAKTSDALIGKNKGKTHSPETRAKMSANRKGKGVKLKLLQEQL